MQYIHSGLEQSLHTKLLPEGGQEGSEEREYQTFKSVVVYEREPYANTRIFRVFYAKKGTNSALIQRTTARRTLPAKWPASKNP